MSGGDGGRWQANTATYTGGTGGRGGNGFIRILAVDPDDIRGEGQADLSGAPSIGGLTLTRPELPSIGQTRLIDLGVFDPVLIGHELIATPFDGEIQVEVQMAVEDPLNPGLPRLEPGMALDTLDEDGDGETDDTLDATMLSEWTPLEELTSLNGRGYRFLRVRVRFRLDPSHSLGDPVPHVERLRIRFEF